MIYGKKTSYLILQHVSDAQVFLNLGFHLYM